MDFLGRLRSQNEYITYFWKLQIIHVVIRQIHPNKTFSQFDLTYVCFTCRNYTSVVNPLATLINLSN